MEGWIKLHRSLIDWEWYQDANTRCVFIHLLLCANHKDKHWRGKLIRRGQRLTSLPHLASELKLSVRNVRTAIKHLKSTNEVTCEATCTCTLLTVVKYDDYQSSTASSDMQNDTLGDTQATHGRHTGDNKQECKKERREETDTKLSTEIGISEEIEGVDFIWSDTSPTKRKKVRGAHLDNFLEFWNLFGVSRDDQINTMMVWRNCGWRSSGEGAAENNRKLLSDILTAATIYTNGKGRKKIPLNWLKDEAWKPRQIITDQHRRIILFFQDKVMSDFRDSAEIQSWNKVKERVTDEDIELLEWFYSLQKSKSNDPTWNRKTTVATLLNQWTGQLELAYAMKSGAKQQINRGREITTEPKKWD
jgi:hypothetical protein